MPVFKRRISQKGFTLIELLLAVTLTAVLATGIYSTFAQGLRLWKRAVEMKPDMESDLTFEKTGADLRNAFNSKRRPFKGEKNVMEFFSYAQQDLVDADHGHRIKQPVWVQYRFDADQGRLLRAEESLRQTLEPPKMKRELEAKNVGGLLKDCSFDYYHEDSEKKTFQWKPFWKNSCAPKAVRISLRYDDGNKIGYLVKILPLQASVCPA